VKGIKIPKWNSIIELAAKVQEAIPDLGFIGVDIVYDKSHGPMVLEINARPGLEIQNANLSALRKRLDRVEGLKIENAAHGAKVAKILFSQRHSDRLMAERGIKIVGTWEEVKIVGKDGNKTLIRSKLDTGAWRTSIDYSLAKELGLLSKGNILWKKYFKSSLGREKRIAIALTYYLAGRKIKTIAGVAKRSGLRAKLIIGRRDLQGFLVRPRGKVGDWR
jgi:hypothetical protein